MARRSDNYPKFKVFGFVVLFWLAFIGLFMAFSFLYSFFPPIDPKMIGMRHGITGTLIAFIVTGVFLKMEKKSFRDIGLVWEKNTPLKFLGGVLAGSLIFGVILLLLVKISGLKLILNNPSFDYRMLIGYLAFIPLALMEEVAFRSYPFRRLADTFGLRSTQVIVGITFALYHLIGGWSLYIAFAGPFVWSFVFGLAAARSGGIAVPTGIHIMLNVLQVLTGLKEGPDSIWKLSYVRGASNGALARTEMTGLLLQVAVLAAAIAGTEYFIRRGNGRAAKKVKLVRTDSDDGAFIGLVKALDADLAKRDGEDHSFYSQFNKIDKIKHVVVAYENGIPTGCGAIKEFSPDSIEVKRMYTLPGSRGKGIASQILAELERWAAELSYGKCVLETGKRQPEAIALYKKRGYRLIPNYGQYAGVENSVCFEKAL